MDGWSWRPAYPLVKPGWKMPSFDGLPAPSPKAQRIHTWVIEVEVQRVPDLVVGHHRAIGAIELSEVTYTLVPQVAHEKLQANEGKDTEAEDSEDHHVSQLLHRLDQGSHDCLQAWESEAGSPTDTLLYGPLGRGWARRRALSLPSPALNRAGDREGDHSQGHSEGGFLGLEDQ